MTLLLAVSCQRELGDLGRKGREIRFGASTGYANGVATRTEYSGKDEEGRSIMSLSKWERVDWVSGFDQIRILCEQASANGPTADYDVVGPTTQGQKSVAGIEPAAGNGLEWGEGTHYFYAMYPVPGMSSNYSFTDNNPVSESNAAIEPSADNGATVSGKIPSVQEAVLVGNEFKANMNYAYMYAAATAEPDGSDVTLEFKPLVTTVEFTFLTPADGGVAGKLTGVSLSSSSTPLCGSFSAVISAANPDNPAVTVSGTGNEVSVTLPGGGVQLRSDEAYKVTLLMLPVAQTDLTLTLNFEGGVKRTLELKDNGTFITIPARKKVYIRNLNVPGSTDKYFIGDIMPVTVDHNGGSASLSDAFQSYKTSEGVSEAVPFELQFSIDGGENWTTTCPDWLTLDTGIDYGGSVEGQSINVTIAPQVNTAVDLQREFLVNATPKTDFDLSTLNVATGATVARSTANCYVVQAPGTYKFPVVYGNGIKGGEKNEDAYHCRDGINGAYRETLDSRFMVYFQDHLDNDITNPYIGLQHEGSILIPQLLWTDIEGLVDGVSISGSGENAYISFNVPVETINEGNALIAVLIDGVVAWSWHIWVSAQDMTAWQSIGTYQFSPVNIGWCQAKEREKYEERSCLVRAVQSVSGAISNATALGYAPVVELPEIIYYEGNNTYYQWGRKDPLQAVMMTSGVRKEYYPTDPAYAPVEINPPGTTITYGYPKYGGSIQTPWATYKSSTADYRWLTRIDRLPPAPDRPLNIAEVGRRSTTYQNAWSSTVPGSTSSMPSYTTVAKSPVTKTVYDPSPVGFSVPQFSAFSALNTTTFPKATLDGVEGRMYKSTFFLPLVPIVQYDIQMPAWPRYWAATAKNYAHAYALVFNNHQYNGMTSSNDYGYTYYSCPIRPQVNY